MHGVDANILVYSIDTRDRDNLRGQARGEEFE